MPRRQNNKGCLNCEIAFLILMAYLTIDLQTMPHSFNELFLDTFSVTSWFLIILTKWHITTYGERRLLINKIRVQKRWFGIINPVHLLHNFYGTFYFFSYQDILFRYDGMLVFLLLVMFSWFMIIIVSCLFASISLPLMKEWYKNRQD